MFVYIVYHAKCTFISATNVRVLRFYNCGKWDSTIHKIKCASKLIEIRSMHIAQFLLGY